MAYLQLAHFVRDHWQLLAWIGGIFVVWFLAGLLIVSRFFRDEWHDET